VNINQRYQVGNGRCTTHERRDLLEVCWDYIEGLEEDFWNSLEYMGKDFVEPKAEKTLHAIEHHHPASLLTPAAFTRQAA